MQDRNEPDVADPRPPGSPSAPPAATSAATSLSLDASAVAPLDRVFPAAPGPFIALVVAVCAGFWLVGFALAPDRAKFLASAEWRFMPFYLGAHLVAVRLFVSTYTRNFRNGVKHLEVSAESAERGVREVLGPIGLGVAILIAAPFCYYDYLYVTGAETRYERMGGTVAAPVDLLLWGTWSLEWVLNALIWVMLVAFLIKTTTMIQSYPFRAPIEIAVYEKHYKPFLQMSAQGASIVLGFSAVTIAYLWATGGELSDYAGLSITVALLLVGFLPSWVLLRRKVRATVERETQALRHDIAKAMWRDAEARKSGAAPGAPIEQRLDEALTIYRISHLEHLKVNLGRTEARAVALRLLAPLLGVGWQVSQNFTAITARLDGVVNSIKAMMSNWAM